MDASQAGSDATAADDAPTADAAAAGPHLTAFWDNAIKLSPDIWYVARSYVRPSTGTPSKIHALAVYFPAGPSPAAAANLVVSADHPCSGGYCTVPLWVPHLAVTPVFAVNGDFFAGVSYTTGSGTADTLHLWESAGTVFDAGNNLGCELSSTGHHVRPSVTTIANLPTGTLNGVGGALMGPAAMGVPTAGDYFAARTVSGTDAQGVLYVLVGEGFDHNSSVSGAGLTFHDLWQAMTDMGATIVCNHDGGGSSQLFIQGRGLVYPAANPRFVANLFGVQD